MPTRPPPRPPQGSAALAITVMLLLLSTIAVLYLNRSVLFEQRTVANQMQATQAHEVAEAGIEWATGMLNAPFDIGANCNLLTTTNQSFRKRYVLTRYNAATNPSSDVAPATNTFPGCKFTPGGLACNCPAVPAGGTAVAALGNALQPSFTVAFEAVPGDAEAVKLTVYACNAQAVACDSTNFTAGDGNARLSVTLKMRAVLRAMPSAPLTCGTTCDLGGSYNIINRDVTTNGILVNAGAGIAAGSGVNSTTLQGQPVNNAMVGNDSSLAALASADTSTCSNSSMFSAYFGSTIEQYRDLPSTKTLSCTSASSCREALTGAYNDGWRSFYMATDLHLSGNDTYGSRNDPITLVTPNAVDLNGGNVFYGLIFSNDAQTDDLGTGSAMIYGAQVSCRGYRNNGNGTLTYDAEALLNARRLTALMVRVPGSWRDFRAGADTLP
ncbi:MAG: pilus assembly PilX N-terminal domain-containing protein [Aquabacterium sp.]|nr:pilus assembly PilX N-terminal domain-containing protein [Aquabacterium sp.]